MLPFLHGTFFFNLYGGTLGTAATTGLLYQPRMIGVGDCGEIGGMKIGRGNKYSEKTFRSAILSTTNSTWLDPGLNPGRRGGKPATNRLSYGAALALDLDTSVSCARRYQWFSRFRSYVI
jgi:hypothetical protein